MAFGIEGFVNGWEFLVAIMAIILGFFLYIEIKGFMASGMGIKSKNPHIIMKNIRRMIISLMLLLPIIWFVDFIISGTITETNLLLDSWLGLAIFLIIFTYFSYWTFLLSKKKKLVNLPKELKP